MVFPPTAGLTGGPNAGDNGVLGSIGGSVNVSALGGATFTIPIEVLPGKDCIQPALSVMYNSQAGNGLLGYGWNLAGISSITRCDKTIYHDNNPVIGNSYTIGDGVNYNEDRFMLDGQRLLSISTNTSYGQDGCLYRTEVDNISRITSYGGDGQNPDKFKVWTKDGYIIEYGYTEDSKFKNPTNNKVAMWMVNKISDYNGNYMTYHYHTTDNHCRIDYIEYTGCGNVQPIYQVEFNYTSSEDSDLFGRLIYNPKTNTSSMYISPYASTHHDAIMFKAITGHELTHAYHFSLVTSGRLSGVDAVNSENAALDYSYMIYSQAGYTDMSSTITYTFQYPRMYYVPANYNFSTIEFAKSIMLPKL